MTDFSSPLPDPSAAAPGGVSAERLTASLAEVLTELVGTSTGPADLAGAARWVHGTFGVAGVAGLQVRAGGLRRLRAWDAGTPQEVPLALNDLAALRTGTAALRPDGLLLPLRGRYRARYALWIWAPGRAWTAAEQAPLRLLALAVGSELERLQADRHLHTLQALHRDLLGGAHTQAYQELLRHAIATIPGAETGSLAVFDGDCFRYVASQTHDEEELTQVSFRLEDSRDRWYGLGLESWSRGVPRVARGSALVEQGQRYLQGDRLIEGNLASLDTIQANITVPILYAGQVTALLNIDSLTDPDAFADDSVDLAASFGVQASLILHEVRLREEITAAARTDDLTGLPNRRAFNEALRLELDAARVHGAPLTLLLMDVHRFKRLNDTFGHAAGDEALRHLGDVLSQPLASGNRTWVPGHRRGAGDRPAHPAPDRYLAFRWGGDEFAVLLPGATEAEGRLVRRSVQQAAAEGQPGERVLLDVGVATLESDDPLGAALLRLADERMYDDKRRHDQ
ncbi:GGDEF domain-containing protein [Deinococcus ficus]|uniref:GGDEF domain-containing protein n=1 Tax=Deinococcus ficus TaxID=317577 RepID=UPI0003B3F7DC|nr:sensor domain-containing diguanylate cyclase [Deinococcus ficus]